MSPAVALRLTPGACLVARPTGVLHLYRGPLTPTGCVPKRNRSLCRARTGRLHVQVIDGAGKRMCTRCTARLAPQSTPVTRDEFRARFAHVTTNDLLAELNAATTADEVDTAAHLSLLLCAPEEARELHKVVGYHRIRVSGEELTAIDRHLRVHGEVARNARRAEREEIYRQSQARIERLGFNNAKSLEPLKKRKEPRR